MYLKLYRPRGIGRLWMESERARVDDSMLLQNVARVLQKVAMALSIFAPSLRHPAQIGKALARSGNVILNC